MNPARDALREQRGKLETAKAKAVRKAEAAERDARDLQAGIDRIDEALDALED